jgi:hypothetical protein
MRVVLKQTSNADPQEFVSKWIVDVADLELESRVAAAQRHNLRSRGYSRNTGWRYI